jgi:hypothetical protein
MAVLMDNPEHADVLRACTIVDRIGKLRDKCLSGVGQNDRESFRT